MLKKMRRAWLWGLLFIATGCNPPPADERLARFAQESIEQQSRQNETIARQSETVVEESSRLADAAAELVAKDAEARQQLIEAQRQLTSDLQVERSHIDQQKRAIDEERRELAESRHREPILAAVIQGLGILIAALLPLAVCIYVLRQLYWSDSSGDEAVAELLLNELTAERPMLVLNSPVQPPALKGPADADDQ